jgi:RHS repeat-associated protein
MSGMLSGENFVQASLNNNRITGFSYDAPGNTVSDGINSYVYNAENQIVSAAGVAYTYDGGGDRVKKSSGRLYWSGALGIMAESDLSGNLAAEYMFFAGARVARRDLPSGAVHYYFSDRLKSTSVVSSALGVIEEESDYRPWGEEKVIIHSLSDQHYKFTGKERGSETGLDLMGARYYGSALGRFMTTDPLGGHYEDPQTLNKYAYVRNNPTTLTDPTGLDFWLQCKGNSGTCQGGHQGTTTTNADGNNTFTATVVTSASLQDSKSGNTGTVNENGVQITTNGQTSQGIFINNTPASDLSGSGKLQDFSFRIDSSDEKKGTLSAGEFTFNGNRDQTRSTLDERGAFRSLTDKRLFGISSVDEIIFHGNSTQHRFGEGPSPHLSVPDNPKNTIPTQGGFQVDRDAPGVKHLGCAIVGVGCN